VLARSEILDDAKLAQDAFLPCGKAELMDRTTYEKIQRRSRAPPQLRSFPSTGIRSSAAFSMGSSAEAVLRSVRAFASRIVLALIDNTQRETLRPERDPVAPASFAEGCEPGSSGMSRALRSYLGTTLAKAASAAVKAVISKIVS
jgi:hypothetical protein